MLFSFCQLDAMTKTNAPFPSQILVVHCRKNGKNKNWFKHTTHTKGTKIRKWNESCGRKSNCLDWDEEEKHQHFALRKSNAEKKSRKWMPRMVCRKCTRKYQTGIQASTKERQKRRTSAINEAVLLFVGEKRKKLRERMADARRDTARQQNSECRGHCRQSQDERRRWRNTKPPPSIVTKHGTQTNTTHKSFLLFFFSVYRITTGTAYAVDLRARAIQNRNVNTATFSPMIFQPDSCIYSVCLRCFVFDINLVWCLCTQTE